MPGFMTLPVSGPSPSIAKEYASTRDISGQSWGRANPGRRSPVQGSKKPGTRSLLVERERRAGRGARAQVFGGEVVMSLSASLSAQASPVDIGPRAAVHLLNRIGYGPRPGEVAQVLRRGLDRYIDEQLESPPDPELDARL